MPSRQARGFCCDEDLARIGYDGLHALDDLEEWRRGDLYPATRELIDVVAGQGVEGAALLDVGAGVGAVHLTLLERGAARAIDVDASREYLAVARSEAERRGLTERVEHRYGDLVVLAAELPPVDVVTLDSVICCYPHLAPLIEGATRTRPRLVGLTYPRDTWSMRTYMRWFNLTHALRRRPDRYFIHRHARVNRLMADAGYRNVYEGGTRSWRVVLYRGSDALARPEGADESGVPVEAGGQPRRTRVRAEGTARGADREVLEFEAAGAEDRLRETTTGSTWNLDGEAVDPRLAGTRLGRS